MEASGLVLRSPAGSPLASIGSSRGTLVRAIRGLALLGLALYAAHSILGLGGHGLDKLFEDWVFHGLLLASAALCLMRAAWSGVERRAWLVLGIGLGGRRDPVRGRSGPGHRRQLPGAERLPLAGVLPRVVRDARTVGACTRARV